METKELIERTELHDSSLIHMTAEGGQVCLQFENVWANDDNCHRVTVALSGARRMTRDNGVVTAMTTLHMEKEDNRVLTFWRAGNIAELLVTWTSYAPPSDETHVYEFEFATFDPQAERQENPPE